MKRYEILMLSVPEITQDEQKQLEKQVDEVVKKEKGTVISFERWGKFRLAFPVKNNDYGIYYLARFEVEKAEPVLNALKTLFAVKLHELVMRYMVTKLEIDQTLAYQRPRSLEEAPARDSFLHDNKVKRILASVESKKEHGRHEKKSETESAKEEQAEPQETEVKVDIEAETVSNEQEA